MLGGHQGGKVILAKADPLTRTHSNIGFLITLCGDKLESLRPERKDEEHSEPERPGRAGRPEAW